VAENLTHAVAFAGSERKWMLKPHSRRIFWVWGLLLAGLLSALTLELMIGVVFIPISEKQKSLFNGE
jgi:hypothetical protein